MIWEKLGKLFFCIHYLCFFIAFPTNLNKLLVFFSDDQHIVIW